MKTKTIFLLAVFLLAAGSFRPASADAEVKDSYLHFIKGLLLDSEGDYGDAFREYKSTIELDPQSLDVYKYAITAAMRVGSLDEAQALGEKLMRENGDSSENCMLMGMIYWAKGDKAKARQYYDKALKLDPQNANALYQIGNMLRADEPEQAVAYLRKYAAAAPESAAQTYYDIAVIEYKQGKNSEAKRDLKLAIQDNEDFLPPRFALAQLYEVEGDTSAALGEYSELELLDPRNSAMLAHVGEIYIESEKAAEAEAYFKKAKALEPSNPVACFWLAVISEKRGDFEAARGYIRDSAAYDKEAGLWLRASYYLTQSGKYKEGVANLEAARKKWPDNLELGYFLALGYDDIGQTAKALELLKIILAAKPDYREAQLQYAVLSEKAGNINDAEAGFKSLLERTPNDAMVLNYLGYSLADRGLKLDEAEKYIARAVELSPGNGAYLDSLGWTHFKMGRGAEALAELKKAAALVPDDEAVWEHLGHTYRAIGNLYGAWYSYKISLMIKPGRKQLESKAAGIESELPKAALAAAYLKYLRALNSELADFSSLCKVTLKAAGREISFDGVFHYQRGKTLSLDLLGPFFTPVWKAKISADTNGVRSFDMDSPGLPEIPDAGRSIERLLSVLWDYYDFGFAGDKNAVLDSSWGKKRIAAAGYYLQLDKSGSNIAALAPAAQSGSRLELEYLLKEKHGRVLPGRVKFKLQGLSGEIIFTRWNAAFDRAGFSLPD